MARMTGNENGYEQWSVDVDVRIPEMGDVRATGVDVDVSATGVSVVFVDRMRLNGERAADEDEQVIITSPAFVAAVRHEVERARALQGMAA